jgi:hypothetical protein
MLIANEHDRQSGVVAKGFGTVLAVSCFGSSSNGFRSHQIHDVAVNALYTGDMTSTWGPR